jgi:hypothetical protein
MSPVCGVHHLAGRPHLADDIPARVTDRAEAWPGRSSLSLFVLQRKRAPNFPNMTKRTRHSPLHHLFQLLEWRGFSDPHIMQLRQFTLPDT